MSSAGYHRVNDGQVSSSLNIVLTDDEDEENSAVDDDFIKRPLIVLDSQVEPETDCGDLLTGGENYDEMSSWKKTRIPSMSIGKVKIFKPNRRRHSGPRSLCGQTCARLCAIVIISLAAGALISWTYKGTGSRWLRLATSGQASVTPIEIADCDQLDHELLWSKTFPKLTIESALRLIGDVNNDTVDDVIVSFGTGADAADYPREACEMYFNMTKIESENGCGGGIMLLDGAKGNVLWTRYVDHELFGVNCNLDIDRDGIRDCVVGGRMASLYAFSGRLGSVLWTISPEEPVAKTSNFYTPLIVKYDFDHDGLTDLVVMHGGDPLRKPGAKHHMTAKLMVISSKTGDILSWSEVPDKAESYYSPQLLTRPDGQQVVLFGTGGETQPGSLWVISLHDLYDKRMDKTAAIFTDCCKGVMVPPVLVDITGDQTEDIIMAMFNSTVVAFDGLTYQKIWSTSFNSSETYSTPSVGRFNDDDVPDFFVAYQNGPGFPIYYYTHAQVLDGKTGKALLDQPIDMLIGTQSSPLTVSTEGKYDFFLFWFSSCNNVSGSGSHEQLSFKVLPGTNVHETSRADFCGLRFNSTLFTELVAMSPANRSILYNSDQFRKLEHSLKINYTELAANWLQRNQASIQEDESALNEDSNNGLDPEISNQQELNVPFEDLPRWPTKQRKRKRPPPFAGSFFDRAYKQRLDRTRRHVGMHDGGGIQRVISTGTLAPSSSKRSGALDVVFASFWFPPSQNVKLMSNKMAACVDNLLRPDAEERLRFSDTPLIGFDHDAYEEYVNDVCSKLHGEQKLSSVQEYNLYNKQMGAMTVYRMSMSCSSSPGKQTAKLRPYSEQIWPSYMGSQADSLANVVALK
ncbi:hypothetical protein HDE_00313 [Halotydeus destructor]|nr:hypothetical protein HDE_00313 [Halotydeus destructor]